MCFLVINIISFRSLFFFFICHPSIVAQQYNYTEEFKVQIAKLRESGKPISAIVKEYGIAKSTISKWHHDYTSSGSFKASDNISAGDKELKLLQKENKRLKMEVDILKQAALIMGRNVE